MSSPKSEGWPLVLARSQWIPGELTAVFRFFEDPMNLARITPPWLGFEVRSMSTPGIQEGTTITYRVRWLGIPMRWVSLIAAWEPPYRFADTALVSPYAYWHHEHTFEATARGVLMRDHVTYRMPFGVLGSLAHALLVRRQLEGIFDYRARVVADLYSGGNILTEPPTPV